MIGQNLRGMLSGFGSVTAASVTTTGNITTTGGYIEFPADAAAPRVRCVTDTDTGIGRDAANELAIFGGGTASVLVTNLQMVTGTSCESVFLGEMESRSKRVRTSRTQDITAATDTLTVSTGQEVIEVTLSAGNITITSTPFIANGDAGQEITIVNADATDTLTLPDEATTAGSNLELRAATRVLAAAGGYIKLRYSTALAAWHEIGFG